MKSRVGCIAGALVLGGGGLLAADEFAISWELDGDSDILERSRGLVGNAPSGDREPPRQFLYSVHVDIRAEGIAKEVRRVWYFPTVASAQEYGSDTIRFDGRTDSVVVREAATLLPSGDVVRFDPEDVQVVDSDTYDEFSDTKEAVILFPGLEPGSLAVLHFEVATDRAAMEVPWSHALYPQQPFPRDHFELTASWEPGREVQWSNDSVHVNCEAGEASIHCVARNILAAEFDSGMNWRDEIGQMVISEYRDWDHVIGVASDAFAKAARRSASASHVYRELIDDGMSRQAVIARLHAFASREIRYVAVSERGHGVTPHAIDETLDRRYGDCKDKSVLLTRLLRLAGVDAYPVLVATRRLAVDRLQIPAMTYFDHALVCFEDGARRRCVDTVDSYTDSSRPAYWVQGRVALELVPGSKPTLIPHDRYRWQVDVDTSIAFDAQGGQTETTVRSYLGAYAGVMRSFLANRSADQAMRWARDEYERVSGNLPEATFEFSGMDDVSEPFSVHSTASYPGLVDADADLDYSEMSVWLMDELNSAILDNQRYRSFFPGLRVSSEHRFAIPPTWRFEWAGPSLNFEFEYGTMRREVRTDAGSVRFSTVLELPARWVTKDEADRFSEFARVLRDEGRLSMYASLSSPP